MFKNSALRTVIRTAVSVAALLGVVGSASAGQYLETWGPLPFSPPFGNLWWRGTALFDTGPCTTDGLHSNSGPCAGMGVSDVTIEFANSPAGATLQTLDFQSAFGAMTLSVQSPNPKPTHASRWSWLARVVHTAQEAEAG